MTTSKTSHSESTKAPRAVKPVENSTDATRGEPLGMRATKRRLELEAALAKLPAEDLRARNDLDVAISSFDALLTGDVDHLTDATAADLSRLLEHSKHLAEKTPTARAR
jgi:hypothetical protein